MTIAAVLAVFASTQVAAATLTVRQHGSATSPVRGSTMWCTVRPPRRQVRTAVPDVAMAPETTVTIESGSTSASTWSSPTAIRQPPGGAAPATRTSPPRLTSTPQPAAVAARTAIRSAARAFAVAPRSSSTPIGTSTSRSAGFHRTRHHPGAGTAGAAGSAESVTIAAKSRS